MADIYYPPFLSSPSSASLAIVRSSNSSVENSPPPASRTPPSPRLRREQRKVLHLLNDESDDGYSPHPSIYEASPVASDDEGRSDKELPGSYDSPKQKPVDFLDTQQNESPGRGRNFSRFSGISMMETITEQKSIKSTRDEILDEVAYAPLQQDEESDEDEDGRFFYDYASPTQPLHPAMSASAPNLGGSPYSSSAEHPTSAPTASTFFSRGISSSPRPFPHQPTFRPALSMNRSYGTLSSHPFHRAPVLVTGSDPYTDGNQHTPDSLESPTYGSRPSSLRNQSLWGKLCRGFCFVCCCVNINDENFP
ncbi:uncharacterized protein LAJ45_06604 [Morchella importuna]|uniref:uncharacterized protein n=1 Tax=Morchella importuna TaxID=1174673 RepID=UPI001E8CBAB7|nr:uncharacterized protein LAJ45_06604 [Morchella importuna]KAH8149524.1 hypothetical protein LAJ45_06604 [Morchella importuna]